MIPKHMALVPKNDVRRAAMMAILDVDNRREQGRWQADYPYARALFRHLMGSKRITRKEINFFAGSIPELKQAKDFLQKLASDINSANMSSCQAAQGIVGGLWPVSQVSNQKICQDIAGDSNIFSDWAASRQGCTVGGQGDNVTNRAGDDKKDQVLKNKNLIWDALGRNHLFDGNRQLKELVMSVVGSIIFNNSGQVTILTPLVDNRDIISVLMRGGTAKIYGCDEPNLCLAPTISDVNVSSDVALVTQVRNLMISIDSKLGADTGLPPVPAALSMVFSGCRRISFPRAWLMPVLRFSGVWTMTPIMGC